MTCYHPEPVTLLYNQCGKRYLPWQESWWPVYIVPDGTYVSRSERTSNLMLWNSGLNLKYSYRLGVLSIVVYDAPWLVVTAWCHLLLSWATMGASVTWQCAPLCKQWIDRAAGDLQHTKKLHQYLVMRPTCFCTTEWRQARVFLCGDQAQLPLSNLKAMNRIWIVSPIYKWQDAFSPHLSRLSILLTLLFMHLQLPSWGESIPEAHRRLTTSVQRVADRFSSENILCITHGTSKPLTVPPVTLNSSSLKSYGAF